MNTRDIIHPKLQHIGLTTANLDAMVDWYQKVVGMTVNFRTAIPTGRTDRPPIPAAFISNDEVFHRISLFENRSLVVDPEKPRHVHLQHMAFEYSSLDELLGTYARLKGLGIMPVMTADEGVGTSFYYTDPDQNTVELNINNYGDNKTATEKMRVASSAGERPGRTEVDPEKMIAAREAGMSPWEVHERAIAGEFAPEQRRFQRLPA